MVNLWLIYLVGGKTTPLKNDGVSSSVGMMTFHSQLFLESHSKFHGSKPPSSSVIRLSKGYLIGECLRGTPFSYLISKRSLSPNQGDTETSLESCKSTPCLERPIYVCV